MEDETNNLVVTPPTRCCGVPYAAYGIGNLLLKDDHVWSFRFRATQTGFLHSIGVWWRYNSPDQTGYSGGDGGVIEFSIQEDDGDHPSGIDLGVGRFTPDIENYPNTTVANAFRPAKFAEQPKLGIGNIYHLVFRNIDQNRDKNYISLNAESIDLWSQIDDGDYEDLMPCREDGFGITVDYGNGKGWVEMLWRFPLFQVNYVNGGYDGLGYQYGNSFIGEQNKAEYQVINADKQFRQSFSDCEGRALEFRFYATKHFGNDPLYVEFISSDQTTFTKAVPASRFLVHENNESNYISESYEWVSIFLPEGTIVPDYVVWSTTAHSEFHIAGLIKAREYTKISTHTKDRAEYSTDGGSSWGPFDAFGRPDRFVVRSAYFKVLAEEQQ